MLKCIFSPNLEILISIGGDLWHGQAQNRVNFDFEVQFDREDHRQSPLKTIGILTKVFYISDPNLVILAWTVDELSHGQAHDWRTHRHTHTHTHTHTHAGNDNTRRPKLASGKNDLNHALSTFVDSEHDTPSFCDSRYIDMSEIQSIFQNNNSEFLILTLNIQSVNAKFNNLYLIINNPASQGLYFGAIC